MSPRSGLASLLLPDETSRRALEETLEDWRMERAKVSSARARIFVNVRGAASVLRVLATTARAGVRQAHVWRFVFASALFAGLAACVQLVLDLPSARPTELLLQLPALAVLFIPLVCAFGVGTRPGTHFPAMTAGAIVLAGMLLTVGWVMPETSQLYRKTAAARIAPGRSLVLTRGINETRLPDLVRQAVSDDRAVRKRARGALSVRFALVLSAPLYVVLGVAVRRRLHPGRSWRVSQAAAGIAAVALFIPASLVALFVQAALPQPWLSVRWEFPWLLTVWLALPIGGLMTWWLARRINDNGGLKPADC